MNYYFITKRLTKFYVVINTNDEGKVVHEAHSHFKLVIPSSEKKIRSS